MLEQEGHRTQGSQSLPRPEALWKPDARPGCTSQKSARTYAQFCPSVDLGQEPLNYGLRPYVTDGYRWSICNPEWKEFCPRSHSQVSGKMGVESGLSEFNVPANSTSQNRPKTYHMTTWEVWTEQRGKLLTSWGEPFTPDNSSLVRGGHCPSPHWQECRCWGLGPTTVLSRGECGQASHQERGEGPGSWTREPRFKAKCWGWGVGVKNTWGGGTMGADGCEFPGSWSQGLENLAPSSWMTFGTRLRTNEQWWVMWEAWPCQEGSPWASTWGNVERFR